MTAVEIIRQLEALDPVEVATVRDWLNDHAPESPELLAAIDEGLRDIAEGRFTEYTQEEFAKKMRQWAGGSK